MPSDWERGYWVHCDWVNSWMTNEEGEDNESNVMPRILIVCRGGRILQHHMITHMDPLRKRDFSVLSKMTYKTDEVHCVDAFAALVKSALPPTRSFNLTSHPKQNLPQGVKDIFDDFDESYRSQCNSCDGAKFSRPIKFASGKVERRTCLCMGLAAIPGVSRDFIGTLYSAATEFYHAKPWLQLRMNHTFRVDFVDGRERWFQVLGGTGLCAVTLVMLSKLELVQHEEWHNEPFKLADDGWYSMMKCEWDSPRLGRAKDDLVLLTEMGVEMPDPKNPNAFTQKVLPEFGKMYLKEKLGADGRRTSMTRQELDEMRVGLRVLARVVSQLQPLPGTPIGDYRQFYSIDVKMKLDDEEFRVVAPAFPESYKTSYLQRHSFVKRPASFPIPSSQTSSNLDIESLETLREIMSLKGKGNDHFKKQEFQLAFNVYSEAMNQFRAKLRSPELLLSPDFDVNKDPAALNRPYANILSNLIQTMLKLPSPDLKQIIKFSTEVLTLHYSKEEGTNQYFLRSLHARAQAHTKLEMWDEAIQDWEYTLSLCDGSRNDRVLPRREVVREEIARAKREKANADSRVLWKKKAVGGDVFHQRFFHTTVLVDGYLIVYGGFGAVDYGDDRFVRGKSLLCRLELRTGKWENLKAKGKGPGALAYHTAVVYKRGMFVFGGEFDEQQEKIFYRLDLDTLEWTTLDFKLLQGSIEAHTALVYENRMIVFGGLESDKGEKLNTLFEYHFEENKWTKHSADSVAARQHHLAWISGSKMFIFGGCTELEDNGVGFNDSYRNDIHSLDLNTMTWTGPIKVQGSLLPRSESQAACFAGTAVYIFGGYSENEFHHSTYYNNGLRFAIPESGDITVSGMISHDGLTPSMRAGCTLTIDAENRRALLVGGYYAQRFQVHGDVWELSVTKRARNQPDGGIIKCGHCDKVGVWKKCARCMAVGYCGADCQRAGWKSHKKDCVKKEKDGDDE